MSPPAIIVLVVVTGLLFDFANGWNDSANAIATVISTRVLRPFTAIALAATLNMLGALLWTEVAKTMARDIIHQADVTQGMVLAAMAAAALWTAGCTMMGLPISASHGLIGALMGAAFVAKGAHVLAWKGLTTIFIALLLSPLVGFLFGWLLMTTLLFLLRKVSPGIVSRVFGKLQLVSVSFMALSHGTADAQKVMGVITLSLIAAGTLPQGSPPPFWVILLCAGAMAAGTATGGWKVIRTLGMRLTDLKPVHGFAAETAAAMVLLTVSKLGIPVSTTHTITGSILGVGATRRLSAVRWGLTRKILFAWVFTLPGSALIAAGLYLGVRLLIP